MSAFTVAFVGSLLHFVTICGVYAVLIVFSWFEIDRKMVQVAAPRQRLEGPLLHYGTDFDKIFTRFY